MLNNDMKKELLETEVIDLFVAENFTDVLSINFTEKKVSTTKGTFDIDMADEDISIKVKELEAQAKVDDDLNKLNQKRNKELQGFIIDDIFMNKEIIKDMAVKFTTLANDKKARWIDKNNNVVEFTKAQLGTLVSKGTDKIEEIYFKYRTLKDQAV
jgi:hypothetical protein